MLGRQTQTVDSRTRSQVTRREFSTQTQRQFLYMDARGDVVKHPNQYFDSGMNLKRMEDAVYFIQKMVRGYFAWKKFKVFQQQ